MDNGKLLMIGIFPPPVSSGERRLNQTIKEMYEQKYVVEFYNVSTGKLNSLGGFAKMKNQITSLLKFIKAMFWARRQFRSSKIAAVIISTPSSSLGHIRDWFFLKFIVKRGVKRIVFVHNGNIDKVFRKKWHAAISRSFARNFELMIFNSEGLRSRMATFVAKEKTKLIPNSVDPSLEFADDVILAKQNELKEFGLFKIVYISNMNPTKGYMDLANAVRLLKKDESFPFEIELNIVGEWLSDGQLEEFKKFMADNELDNCIKIQGKIADRNLLKQFYLESHLFCLPTYFPQEAQPVSIIEALSAATPVLSTHHASIPEYVFDGVNGYLVDKKSPEQLAERMRSICQSDEWLQLSEGARRSFLANFSRDIYFKNLVECITT